ncbi:MAG: YceH family protein [Elusimicrobia bacterium]|nr:YceH family protein [Elusimicrobiota bacterium]
MITQLDAVEARALGALVEKSITTKEQYPLSFNSLLLACNQKSSREPVMDLDTETLGRAVESLIAKGLAERLQAPGERVPKFRHDIGRLLGTDDAKVIGAMTVLLLRGAQTPGEIKTRAERLCEFASTAEVEGLLQRLSGAAEPMAARLPRQPGQKETRYYHLFSGAAAPASSPAAETAPVQLPPSADRLAALEKRLEELEARVRELEGGRLPPADRPL